MATKRTLTDPAIRPLSPGTWEAFERLANKHNGVWGGCWCTWFHPQRDELARGSGAQGTHDLKKRLAADGLAHAALVFDGEAAVAWCEYGPPGELTRIYHREEVEREGYVPPDWRITCFFVDRDYRRHGVARVALGGALDLIAASGGGVVESYPQDPASAAKVAPSFLYNGTRSMFEDAGFAFERHKGNGKNCVMRLNVAARPAQPSHPKARHAR